MKTLRVEIPKAVWLVAALVGFASIPLFFLPSKPMLPVYQGDTLSQWIVKLDQAADVHPARYQEVAAAQGAIRAIGTNALPFALSNLRARVTLTDELASWLSRYAPFRKLKPKNVADQWALGVQLLDILGPIAKPCLPELIAEATNNPGFSEDALMAVGPAALPALTNFLQTTQFPEKVQFIKALTKAVGWRIKRDDATVALPFLIASIHSTNHDVSASSAEAVGVIHLQPELCMPLLVEGLSDTNPEYRSVWIRSLGEFGEAASPYANKIAVAYADLDPLVRWAVCGALGNLHSAATISVPVLICGLQDATPMVRFQAAQALGKFGPRATNATATLEQSCSDADEAVRFAATQSLKSIRR
jgi:hypothetical protein